MMEDNFRRALTIAKGNPAVFVSRPISATILVIAAILLLIVIAPSVRKRREEVFKET
jgi:putative tricarboxylic transport membrane protein